MEIVAYVFGFFGFLAWLQVSSLEKKLADVERELTRMKGTSYHQDRSALVQATKSYIGQQVRIDLKEDHEDVDIFNYGNSPSGSITVLDSDNEWLLIQVSSKKGSVRKLIRMESVEGISVIK